MSWGGWCSLRLIFGGRGGLDKGISFSKPKLRLGKD